MTTEPRSAAEPSTPAIVRLIGRAQHYAWGDLARLPSLLGLEPDGRPYAEWWLGDHPVAPSTAVRTDGSEHPISSVIDAPLPYLLKILAVAAPLSLQVHPSRGQAESGFARESDAGVAVDAPTRSYRDRNHKPELIVALTPFEALCGFVDCTEARRRLAALAPNGEFAPLVTLIGAPNESAIGTRNDTAIGTAIVRAILTADATTRQRWSDTVASNADRAGLGHLGPIAERYPGDGGVVLAALLNHIRLEPGQGLFLDAGVLHAYLDGLGVEVMASSDNVVRGGLTPKHLDIDELIAIVRTDGGPAAALTSVPDGAAQRWPTPAPDFALRCVTSPMSLGASTDPRIVLCTAGIATVRSDAAAVTLRAGESALLCRDARVDVEGADGTFQLFEVGVGRR